MLGFRVVRGPGWSWNEQDGGEGHTGTIVEVDSPKLAKDTVIVQWDCGKRTNYCIGYKGIYDLCVLDSAPAGIKHLNKHCDGCSRGIIYGARWTCQQCADTDLCTPCYMNDRHDTFHKFYRFDTTSGSGIAVSPRCESNSKLKSRGLFPGAQVVRGHNWEWGNQDAGQPGIITTIQDRDQTTQRSVAEVEWKNGIRNIYRVGHKGKVDLKCLQPSCGSFYYRAHLPVCGKEHQFLPPLASKRSSPRLKQGDAVRIMLSGDVLRSLQCGHGGWDPVMKQLIGKNGWVHRITEAGDVRVRYERHHLRDVEIDQTKWTIHPDALELVGSRDDNEHSLMRLSNEESLSSFESSAELFTGIQSMHVDGCNDLSYVSDDPTCSIDDVSSSFQNLETRYDPSEKVRMMIQFSQSGDLDGLRKIMSTSPALNINKARIDEFAKQSRVCDRDADNDVETQCDIPDSSWTPLHYAIVSKHVEVVHFLLDECSADVNLMTRKGSSPLHLAVSRGTLEEVKLLLDRGADITLENCDDNTAIHLSVKRPNNHAITSLLCGHPIVDSLLSIRNKTGYNPLHCAIAQRDERSVNIILERSSALSNEPTQDGRYPLHLAAESNQSVIAQLLLTKGCNVNACSLDGESPLYTACRVGSLSCVEMLVGRGADVKYTKDKSSCVMAAMQSPPAQASTGPTTNQLWNQLLKIVEKHTAGSNIPASLLISSFLTFHGAILPDLPEYPWMQCLTECHRASVRAVDPSHNGNDVNDSYHQISAELEKLKEELQCQICMDLKRSFVFDCGHGCCEECKEKLFICPFCMKDIKKAIKTFP